MLPMFPEEQSTYSVSLLNVYIRQMFEMDYRLRDVWVEGEVSDFKQPASGHSYFTLKDERSQLNAVMWKTQVASQWYISKHGDKILAHGSVGVYEARGQYQLYCDELVSLAATGDLHARFRLLWEKLDA